MERPIPKEYKRPDKIADYPIGPNFTSGNLIDVAAGMRTFRPVIDTEKCVHCLRCFLLCPDGAIDKSGTELEIDFNYCKGCGICAHECKVKAVRMEKEGDGQ
ncbi:MAG: 4Fe-4S binding protein [Negativicutes bacterium]|nr:4Fe-4S binding protein [Negativicutes bacterium]